MKTLHDAEIPRASMDFVPNHWPEGQVDTRTGDFERSNRACVRQP